MAVVRPTVRERARQPHPTSSAHDQPADCLIGHVLDGKYTIKDLVGRGGVGVVYTANCHSSNREVVVKLLAPKWANDDEALARFEREAMRLSGLKHPNIVMMYEYGMEARRPYLAMEYLRGELLSKYLARKRRLPLARFVPIAAQILKGVGHAHSRGIMVRDIKPANIMLCERKGRANFVKLLDFGLAKLTEEEEKITEQHVIGTVGYLSPEQIRGDALDLRVDVYALGVLFYYMLSGRRPFEGGSNAAVFDKTVNERPANLEDLLPLNHGIPDGAIDLIHSCLAKERSDRPSNADEILEGLIDAVPAAMFDLPRVETLRHRALLDAEPSGGNTGMMALLGTRVASKAKPLRSSGATIDPHRGTPLSVAVRPPPEGSGGVDGGTSSYPWTFAGFFMRSPTEQAAVLLIAGALLAVLGGGFVTWILVGSDNEAGKVASAEDKSGANALGLAGVDELIEVRRLMAAGRRFEVEDRPASAMEAYRGVLELSPSHEPARRALARLKDAPLRGEMQIQSRPVARVYIDGNAVGTTPFEGKLSVGQHQVRLTARGYYNFNEVITVTAEDNTPLAATLKGRRRTTRSAKDGAPRTALASRTPDKKTSPRSSPFLPTRDRKRAKEAGPAPGTFLTTSD